MMSSEQIREMASKHARKAKRLGTKPLVVTAKNLATLMAGTEKIPFLGDYVPKGFYLLEELFVDEPAMTLERFLSSLEIGKGYAIREAGEFQVYVGVYGVNYPEKDIKNMPCVSCGRKDLPLHADYKCPNCSKYSK